MPEKLSRSLPLSIELHKADSSHKGTAMCSLI